MTVQTRTRPILARSGNNAHRPYNSHEGTCISLSVSLCYKRRTATDRRPAGRLRKKAPRAADRLDECSYKAAGAIMISRVCSRDEFYWFLRGEREGQRRVRWPNGVAARLTISECGVTDAQYPAGSFHSWSSLKASLNFLHTPGLFCSARVRTY